MVAALVLLALVTGAAFWLVGCYNRLVSLRNQFKNSFAQIDVQLKRRYDLIPNLVETAKAYLQHEHDTLAAVIAARGHAVSANARMADNPANPAAVRQLDAAETVLTSSLGKLFAVVEAYPELKANQTMAQLTEELTSTENRIAFARQAYNDGVMEYNVSLEQFPGSIVTNLFAFKSGELLQSTDTPDERKAIKVNF